MPWVTEGVARRGVSTPRGKWRSEAYRSPPAPARSLQAWARYFSGRGATGIYTDDGSRGYQGPVTGLLKRDIGRYDPMETLIFACGPTPMVWALRSLLREHPISCQVSLEERMACGLGACLGCAVAIRGPEGKREYRRVCQDGPVFDLREVLLAAPRGR